MATFQPPVVNDLPGTYGTFDPHHPVPLISHRLFRHFGGNPRGRSVLKINGTYRTVAYPSQDLIDSATEVYLGGHVYTISSTVATALTAAGYGSGIT